MTLSFLGPESLTGTLGTVPGVAALTFEAIAGRRAVGEVNTQRRKAFKWLCDDAAETFEEDKTLEAVTFLLAVAQHKY